ncbi:hypothetical protein [Pinirhizobacter sp.]|uniref:hypothetical protein n=1 Tax=Pinirhizobacter sp. TaxID=2950432 RepID=UPI002F40627D
MRNTTPDRDTIVRDAPSADELNAHIRARTSKLLAESEKIAAEARWYPFVAVAGIFAAAVGFVKLLD